jgi:predicted Zn-dependent peptidase
MAGAAARVPGFGWFGGKYKGRLNASAFDSQRAGVFPLESHASYKKFTTGEYSQWDRSMREPLVIRPSNIRVPQHTPAPPAPITSSAFTFQNGLRWLQLEGSPHPLGTIAIFVPSGSRFESHKTSGASHLMKHLIYKGSGTHSDLELARELEQLGATLDVQVTREYTMLSTRFFLADTPFVSRALFSTIRRDVPPFIGDVEYKVGEAWEMTERESSAAANCGRTSVAEALHREAFRGSSLANPLLAPTHQAHHMCGEALSKYIAEHYAPNHALVVSMGLSHEECLVAAGAGLEKQVMLENPNSSIVEPKPLQVPTAKYIGGGESRTVAGGPTHVAVAVEGAGRASADWAAFKVLEAALGGGGSNRHINPGQGVTSRLAQVAKSTAGVLDTSSFNFSYSDVGLFGAYAKVEGGNSAAKTLQALHAALSKLGNLSDDEVQRARNTALRRHLRAQEETLGVVEQHGEAHVLGVAQEPASIANVDAAAVRRLGAKLASSKPVVAAYGDVNSLPRL